ncbi:hypothetical protein BU24DRAFT_353469 [Aaosphaeria arxii CBS 175.79]|uniref:EI24-domain-containing protein n=1 Tax=Aaosphaeria arxii CBS 175.79 TaxID=1450172 RepID=A0A6A5XGX0_9PLEO|nr:uncharacterized protein BU24DRAFT_353469 [Aaosphaeria arxii CBS 175.79]KAF2012041.1 hypothetical protein BU24DRAFT_353469 [Aaosphaeria arxii CBS 175.79]
MPQQRPRQNPIRSIPQVLIYPTRDNVHACLYPFKGVIYFAAHPFLYPLLKARLLPAFLLSLFVYINLFLWAYLPQVAFLALFHRGGSAWVNGTFLVLGEGAAAVAILFECFLVDESQVDIFDAVLVHKGYDDLVSQFRPVSEDSLNNPVQRLGKPTRSSVYGPFSFRQIAEFVILLPLNFVPYVGVPLFLFLTGYRAGPLQHWRYFNLRGFDRKARDAFVKRRRWQYTWYGAVYLMLQLIPGFSMLFLLTAAVSSALWAADLETVRRRREAQASPAQGYTDDDATPEEAV